MIQRIGIFVFVIAIGVCSFGTTAEAQQISRNNPFRSFNLTGYNYGSVRWERQQQRKRYLQPAQRTTNFARRRTGLGLLRRR